MYSFIGSAVITCSGVYEDGSDRALSSLEDLVESTVSSKVASVCVFPMSLLPVGHALIFDHVKA